MLLYGDLYPSLSISPEFLIYFVLELLLGLLRMMSWEEEEACLA
jgi:hypothetical protein